MIDLSTIRSLELIQNLQTAKSKDCLFGLINHTLTPMGSRFLKSNLLQPSTDKDVLEKRWDALEELTVKEDVFFAIRQGILMLLQPRCCFLFYFPLVSSASEASRRRASIDDGCMDVADFYDSSQDVRRCGSCVDIGSAAWNRGNCQVD